MKHMKINKSALRGMLAMALAGSLLALQSVPAVAAEKSLAGIAIFSKAKSVLAKYGNPSQIQVGRNFAMTSNGGAGQQAGQPGAPSQSPGALPGFGVVTPPGAFAGGGSPAPPASPASGITTATTNQGDGEVTWIYDRPNGVNYEFTLSSDGRVVQIRVTGYKSTVRTGRGIALGQNYGQVLQKYGFPESQITTPATLTLTMNFVKGQGTASAATTSTSTVVPLNVLSIFYVQRGHIAFQFLNQRVVGIIVAAAG